MARPNIVVFLNKMVEPARLTPATSMPLHSAAFWEFPLAA